MRIFTILVISFSLFSCGNSHVEKEDAVLIEKADTNSLSDKNGSDTIRQSVLKVFLPKMTFSKSEIIKKVAEIDKHRSGNDVEWKSSDFIEGCSVEKCFHEGRVIYISYGCGDCSPVMSQDEYYFFNEEVICQKTSVINYNYPPCWSEKECLENGITEEYKKKNVKKRNDTYYVLDSLHLSFKRTGNFNDTSYVMNDTLDPSEILQAATEFLNTKNINR